MEEELRYRRLATALRDQYPRFLADWSQAFRGSSLRLPGAFDEQDALRLVAPVFENLAEALPLPRLEPGSPELRELEKSIAFLGQVTGGSGRSGFDVAAMVITLRDLLLGWTDGDERDELTRLFEWLLVVALESCGAAGATAAHERQRDALERGTPVVLISPAVPAAFLVGLGDNLVLDSVFGRLLMLVVRVGARSIIIDATGLDDPGSAPVMVAMEHLFSHPRMRNDLLVLAVGLDSAAEARWSALATRTEIPLHRADSFDQALILALQRTDYRLVRRPE